MEKLIRILKYNLLPALVIIILLLNGCTQNSKSENTSYTNITKEATNSQLAINKSSEFVHTQQVKRNVSSAQPELAKFNQIKSELEQALKSRGITPESYERLTASIKDLEESNFDRNATEELWKMLSQLQVGGKQKTVANNTTKTSNTQEPANASETFNENPSDHIPSKPSIVLWHYSENEWKPNGKPPECPPYIEFQLPVDRKLVSSILYPGQVRGGDFKPHGGFRTDGASGPIKVSAPMEGYVVDVARFYDEFGIHYMFDIQNPCGIMYRLGHLGEVPQKLEALFEKQTEIKTGDSRTFEVEPLFIEMGETIAINTQQGSGFDWGVYDLRKENTAVQDPLFRKEHADEPAQAYHALCWLDLLPPEDQTFVKSLPAADGISGKNSAYCK